MIKIYWVHYLYTHEFASSCQSFKLNLLILWVKWIQRLIFMMIIVWSILELNSTSKYQQIFDLSLESRTGLPHLLNPQYSTRSEPLDSSWQEYYYSLFQHMLYMARWECLVFEFYLKCIHSCKSHNNYWLLSFDWLDCFEKYSMLFSIF